MKKVAIKDENTERKLLFLAAIYPSMTLEEIVKNAVDDLWEKEKQKVKEAVLDIASDD